MSSSYQVDTTAGPWRIGAASGGHSKHARLIIRTQRTDRRYARCHGGQWEIPCPATTLSVHAAGEAAAFIRQNIMYTHRDALNILKGGDCLERLHLWVRLLVTETECLSLLGPLFAAELKLAAHLKEMNR